MSVSKNYVISYIETLIHNLIYNFDGQDILHGQNLLQSHYAHLCNAFLICVLPIFKFTNSPQTNLRMTLYYHTILSEVFLHVIALLHCLQCKTFINYSFLLFLACSRIGSKKHTCNYHFICIHKYLFNDKIQFEVFL